MALCGAKNRSGEPCKKHALKGSKRCRLHGGKSTGNPKAKGNASAVKHGIYSAFLTDEENVIAKDLELGSIDEELRLTRIRLMRALKIEQNAPPVELESRTERDIDTSVGARSEDTFKRRDYVSIIDRLTARIESLEMKREAIIGTRLDNEIKKRELAKIDMENSAKDQGPVGRIEVKVVTCAPSK